MILYSGPIRQRFAHILALVLLVCSPLAARAQDSGLTSMETGQDSRGWEAVGRIDISGKGFCTGALIREDLVLTAAHCLFDQDGTPIAADRFQFLAGFRDGRAEAYRGVRRAIAHPSYVFRQSGTNATDVAQDIALLELDQPIRTTRLKPFPIAARPAIGAQVGIVSYGKDRAEAPSLQEVCSVIAEQDGVLIMSCAVDFGSSGSPVFMVQSGVASVVSVVSAMAELDGEKVSLGTLLTQPIEDILAVVDGGQTMRPVGNARAIVPGQRNDTGAKFVSSGG